MLYALQELLDKPEDAPDIPPGVVQWLQARLNPGFVMASGHIKKLKAEGYSDAAIAGFLLGVQYAVNIVDEAGAIRESYKS